MCDELIESGPLNHPVGLFALADRMEDSSSSTLHRNEDT